MVSLAPYSHSVALLSQAPVCPVQEFSVRLHPPARFRPLSQSFINKATGNMEERCERLYQAKGHHFEEGGKSLFV